MKAVGLYELRVFVTEGTKCTTRYVQQKYNILLRKMMRKLEIQAVYSPNLSEILSSGDPMFQNVRGTYPPAPKVLPLTLYHVTLTC